ncbi:hypothetical protein V6N13_115995 [Hibiscus sabdariffa]|uniref:Uncharacterized protein n=1 Tax=Hibiscus sabdariffa TaxID=183260 RepID=A0ABR2QSF7_9ROSI
MYISLSNDDSHASQGFPRDDSSNPNSSYHHHQLLHQYTHQAHQQHPSSPTSNTPGPQGPQPVLHCPSPVLHALRIVAKIPATLVLKSNHFRHGIHPLCSFIHLTMNNPIRCLLFQFLFHP